MKPLQIEDQARTEPTEGGVNLDGEASPRSPRHRWSPTGGRSFYFIVNLLDDKGRW